MVISECGREGTLDEGIVWGPRLYMMRGLAFSVSCFAYKVNLLGTWNLGPLAQHGDAFDGRKPLPLCDVHLY